ncbi:TPA: exosome complex exonuclease Rrp41 [Candidatus Micrarchaeota archaeon]|nr:exosome complex exonuclease Rrp41 [Candidatus Micrarchaeota archaeon]
MAGTTDKQLIIDGKRTDGRTIDEIRPLRIEVGVISSADGSALVEWGGNKVLCGVYGPRECIPKHEASPYGALIKCRYSMSPFASLSEHGRSGPNRRSLEISKVIREVFENLIIAENFPKTQINIFIDVLQADGGTRVASITAASAALASAGIPMRDVVSAIATGKVDGQMVVDLGKDEDNFGQSDMPIALSHRKKDILLLQMDGLLTKEEILKALDMAEKSCEKVHEVQVAAVRKIYESAALSEQKISL